MINGYVSFFVGREEGGGGRCVLVDGKVLGLWSEAGKTPLVFVVPTVIPSERPLKVRVEDVCFSCLCSDPNIHGQSRVQVPSFLPAASSTAFSQLVRDIHQPSNPATSPNAIATPVQSPHKPQPAPNAKPKLTGIATA